MKIEISLPVDPAELFTVRKAVRPAGVVGRALQHSAERPLGSGPDFARTIGPAMGRVADLSPDARIARPTEAGGVSSPEMVMKLVSAAP